VSGSRGTRHGRVVHIINRNTTRRSIITHYLHNISGEGDQIEVQRDMLQANFNTLNAAGEEAGLRINIS